MPFHRQPFRLDWKRFWDWKYTKVVALRNTMKFDLANALWPEKSLSRSDFRGETRTESEFDEDTITLVEVLCRVLLFNDDHHTFDEVIGQVIKATGCSTEKAEGYAWEVHNTGKAMVFEGELFHCLQVSSVLEEIALHTQVLT